MSTYEAELRNAVCNNAPTVAMILHEEDLYPVYVAELDRTWQAESRRNPADVSVTVPVATYNRWKAAREEFFQAQTEMEALFNGVPQD